MQILTDYIHNEFVSVDISETKIKENIRTHTALFKRTFTFRRILPLTSKPQQQTSHQPHGCLKG